MLTPQPLTRMLSMSPYVLFGKALLTLGLALWAADAMTESARTDLARGEALTLEEYTAGYEAHRADLMDDTDGFGVNAAIMIVLFAGTVALYEVLGYGLGRATQAITERNAREQGAHVPGPDSAASGSAPPA